MALITLGYDAKYFDKYAASFGGKKFPRNVDTFIPDYTASLPRRQ
jgi:hypothetical protein